MNSPSQTFCAWRRYKAVGGKRVTKSVKESVNDNSVCKAAPGFGASAYHNLSQYEVIKTLQPIWTVIIALPMISNNVIHT